ncbi:chitin biosynthesis protein CHS5 [Microdochium nivale]|nr:chitin biosynthesis protein CHS5 [Microdochium nivale]
MTISLGAFRAAHWLTSAPSRVRNVSLSSPAAQTGSLLRRTLHQRSPKSLDVQPTSKKPYRAPWSGASIDGRPVILDDQVKAFSNRHQIFLPTSMRGLRISWPSAMRDRVAFSVSIAPAHTFDEKHFKYVDRDEHPLRASILDTYAAKKEEESLWLWAVSPPSSAAIFVCHVAQRKIRHAFRTALGQRGYDRYGWRADPEKTRPVYMDENGKPIVSRYPRLVGTIKIRSDAKPVAQAEFENLVAQMRVILRHVESEFGTDTKTGPLSLARSQRDDSPRRQPRQEGRADATKWSGSSRPVQSVGSRMPWQPQAKHKKA